VKPAILLHICCAPDATHCIELLSKEFQVSGYFDNPNVYPMNEYLKRLGETEQLMDKLGLVLHKGKYQPDLWRGWTEGMETEPEGGKRCLVCYRMRLENTARFAKHKGFRKFTTTLTVSPHKNPHIIFSIGRELAVKYGIDFLEVDFKKHDGFRKSVEISKQLGLYRQDYCGCIHSLEKRLVVRKKRLTELLGEIRNCQKCGIPRTQKVLPSGGADSEVMVIGQSPGKRELVTSEPFSGPAGARLFRWFAGIGIDEADLRSVAYITAVMKCYPGHVPGRKIDKSPAPSQTRNCAPFLERELRIVRPRLLVPVGRLAVNATVGERRLVRVVGKRLKQQIFGHSCTVVSLPHPSGANPWSFRNPKQLDRALSLLREEMRKRRDG